ncbi:glycerate kinase [Rhodoferax sp.]|uniref:glycerate kinase type-2 family protein n=1 Tax=Rhodoferax sp. TaxID=50421 RepID=UPI00260ADDBD|nr:glycerate kinase [Rhodoferax sp.]MDD2809139.1 glycerate kinase [Rhodoferax sp.]
MPDIPPPAARALLRQMLDAAVAAAQPALCLPAQLPAPPRGRTIVIGAGKASAAMARALEDHWPAPLQGLVVTRYGYQVPCQRIEIAQAAHPVPDAAGLAATQRILQSVQGLTADDLVLALISGGGSSLLVAPCAGLTLSDKQNINQALLASGASIAEMNCMRRHLSGVKGGRLGAVCAPAQLVTLLISDVPGDAPADIASGPTVADVSTCADALAIAQRYQIDLPAAAHAWLASGAGETLKPNDVRLARSSVRMVTTPQMALQAAAQVAQAAGFTPYILGDSLEGEAREVAKVHAGMARQVLRHGQPFQTPCVLLSGGETTVTLKGAGRGGRNVEFLLALGLALADLPGVYALAADTDGVDGMEDIAGAVLTPDSLQRAWAQGLNPRSFLDHNDAHSFFQALGDSVITGPTLTNVNDFRVILIP